MTERAKRFSWAVVGVSVATAVFVLLVAAHVRSSATSPRPVREIVLEARGTAFDGNNPTLEVEAGERVRLVVRNNDPGVTHSIAVPSLGAERVDVAPGTEIVVEFVAEESGVYAYECPQHLPLMKGTLVVRPASP